MKLFDVVANILAGLLVWVLLTGIVYFFVSWGSDDPQVRPTPFWPLKAAILALSAVTFSFYVRRYWKKLDR